MFLCFIFIIFILTNLFYLFNLSFYENNHNYIILLVLFIIKLQKYKIINLYKIIFLLI
jgi:hypothetical protein